LRRKGFVEVQGAQVRVLDGRFESFKEWVHWWLCRVARIALSVVAMLLIG
jgi:hypothetical protein